MISVSHEKTSDKSKLKNIVQNTWPEVLKIILVKKDEGKQERQKLEETKETGTKWNKAFWIGSSDRRKKSVQKLVKSG